MSDAKSWSLTETADRYYGHKKSDGCSPSFLSSARWHIQHFMVWLKKQGFDPGQNKTNGLTSVILAGYRQMLAENSTISIVSYVIGLHKHRCDHEIVHHEGIRALHAHIQWNHGVEATF